MRKLFAMALRHKVTVEERTRVADGAGGFEEGWQEVVTLWASIDPVRASERYAAGQMAATATHKIVMRYHSAIKAPMRFSWNGKHFNIRAITNIGEKDRFLEIYAEEGVGV